MKPYTYKGLREAVGLSSDEYASLYKAWKRMLGRCYDSRNASYEVYHNKHIEVSVEWKYSFENFLRWSLVNGWKKGLSLDRIDNDGDYSPDNCRWATSKTQCRNRCSCVYITHEGEIKTLIEWCEIFGIPHYLASNRIRRGWTDFNAIFSKVDARNGGVLHY